MTLTVLIARHVHINGQQQDFELKYKKLDKDAVVGEPILDHVRLTIKFGS